MSRRGRSFCANTLTARLAFQNSGPRLAGPRRALCGCSAQPGTRRPETSSRWSPIFRRSKVPYSKFARGVQPRLDHAHLPFSVPVSYCCGSWRLFRMSTLTASPIVAAAGGSFLLKSRTPAEVFTPEDLNEEQRQIADTAARFAREEILPLTAAIEAKEPGVLKSLLRKAAELGFTSVDIPEEYGGVGMDKTTSTLITDHLSILASVSTAFGAHTGIATLPLVWYGTEEQKQRYLPKLATAEWIGSYGLSEASSGSDAMNVRTRATLSADGSHYTLNGEKMWITNCGIASLYTVFAKIVDPETGGEKFSAFLIERDTPGLTVGAEEHKLGIRGSSTCPLVLDDCKIPAANLLGEAGKGHHIAFNVLNVGRFKLGVACIGGARHALAHMISYAKERIAFGKPIAEFGLIQRKISRGATRLYAAESMAYRTVGMIDAGLAQLGPEKAHAPREIQRRIEE